MFMTNDNIYFGIDNERWIITGFQHIPLKRLISALNRGAFEGWKLVTEMDIFTTIMSEPNKIGILVKHPESVFGLSNKHHDKNLREILCTPTQGKYQKSSWGYKIAIAPKSLEFKNKWPPAEYYFLDFCEQLYTGQFGLIALT